MRDAPDASFVRRVYLRHNARRSGVRDYIMTYMFRVRRSFQRDGFGPRAAIVEMTESFVTDEFRVWRQTRTGLLITR